MPDLATLIAERDIYRALTAVARAMDARDWEGLRNHLLPAMSADMGTGPLEGRDAVIAMMRSFLDDCGPTQHLLGNVEIDVAGERARSRCYVSDMHLGAGERAHLSFRTLGDYHDQWQRVDGRWLLSHRTKLNRAHIGSFEALGPGPEGWRDTATD